MPQPNSAISPILDAEQILPRVRILDESAFENFAAQLRGLIHQAGATAQMVIAAAAQADAASARLNGACDRAVALLGHEAGVDAMPATGSLGQAILIAQRSMEELHATCKEMNTEAGQCQDAQRNLARTILHATALREDIARSLDRPAVPGVPPRLSIPGELIEPKPERATMETRAAA